MFTTEMMKKAHEMTRNLISETSEKISYSVTFAECVKYLCKLAKISAEAWEAVTAEEEFFAMTEEEQIGFMTASAIDMYKYSVAESTHRGKHRRNDFDWIAQENFMDGIQNVVAQMWVELPDYFQSEKHADKPLAVILANCALTSAYHIRIAEHYHVNAQRYSMDTDSVYIESALVQADKIAPSPEDALCMVDSIESIALDLKDEIILCDMVRGFTQQETADKIGLSQRGVSKRIQAMYKRYGMDI